MNNTPDNAKELMSLKAEFELLKTTIAMAVEQMKDAINLFLDNPRKPESTAMEAKPETSSAPTNQNQTQLDIPSLIADLKQEIATIVTETRTLFHRQSVPMLHTNYLPSKTRVQP